MEIEILNKLLCKGVSPKRRPLLFNDRVGFAFGKYYLRYGIQRNVVSHLSVGTMSNQESANVSQ